MLQEKSVLWNHRKKECLGLGSPETDPEMRIYMQILLKKGFIEEASRLEEVQEIVNRTGIREWEYQEAEAKSEKRFYE